MTLILAAALLSYPPHTLPLYIYVLYTQLPPTTARRFGRSQTLSDETLPLLNPIQSLIPVSELHYVNSHSIEILIWKWETRILIHDKPVLCMQMIINWTMTYVWLNFQVASSRYTG